MKLKKKNLSRMWFCEYSFALLSVLLKVQVHTRIHILWNTLYLVANDLLLQLKKHMPVTLSTNFKVRAECLDVCNNFMNFSILKSAIENKKIITKFQFKSIDAWQNYFPNISLRTFNRKLVFWFIFIIGQKKKSQSE